MIYVYTCHATHEVKLKHPYPAHVVGCQAELPAWWTPRGFTVCGLWAWLDRTETDSTLESDPGSGPSGAQNQAQT